MLKTLFVLAAPPLLTALLLSGCAIAQLEPQGEAVRIVDAISLTDLESYEPAGRFQAYAMATPEDCRNELRNIAGGVQIPFIRITSLEPEWCYGDGWTESGRAGGKQCFTAWADGYRPKLPPAAASTP